MTTAAPSTDAGAVGASPPAWPIVALQQALTAHLPGGVVEVLERIDSTNTELMRRAREGHCAPTLLVAEQQTAGRGRLGRQWLSSPGDSLTFSLGLPLAPRDWSGLSLAVGLSVAESLQPVPPASDRLLGLKWPNDLWLADDRKLGGILIETASFLLPGAAEGFPTPPSASVRYVVIGIGINIRPRDPQGLATPPACLQDIAPDMDAPSALLRLLEPLLATVQAFAAHGFAPLRARYAARDLLAGREVLLSDGASGVAQGVGADGALQVQTPAGLRAITSAEVSVRPRAGAAGEAAVAAACADAAAADDSDGIRAATAGHPAAPSSTAT